MGLRIFSKNLRTTSKIQAAEERCEGSSSCWSRITEQTRVSLLCEYFCSVHSNRYTFLYATTEPAFYAENIERNYTEHNLQTNQVAGICGLPYNAI